MSGYVVDASVIVPCLTDEPEFSERSRGFIQANRDQIVMPSLGLYEVANSLWKKQRSGALGSPDDVIPALRQLAVIVAVEELTPAMFETAVSYAIGADHPVYDCVYLALAHGTGRQLATNDKRMADKLAPHEGVFVLKE